MTNENKNTKKEQRVVLNLSTSQAEELKTFLGQCPYLGESRDIILGLHRRIEKTLNKQAGLGPARIIESPTELNQKCVSCGSTATLPEPNGTLLCEGCGAIQEAD